MSSSAVMHLPLRIKRSAKAVGEETLVSVTMSFTSALVLEGSVAGSASMIGAGVLLRPDSFGGEYSGSRSILSVSFRAGVSGGSSSGAGTFGERVPSEGSPFQKFSFGGRNPFGGARSRGTPA